MNVTLDKNTILAGLKVITFVQPLKESIRVATEPDRIRFFGYNRPIGSEIEAWFPCEPTAFGSVMLPGERLHTLASNTRKGTSISLYTKNDKLMVGIGRLKGKLCADSQAVQTNLLATRYGQSEFQTSFESSTPIRGIIRKITKPAKTIDESMPFDGMLQLQVTPKVGIIGRTTDGRRLAEARFEFDPDVETQMTWHVPGQALNVLAKIAEESEDTFSLAFGSNFMNVSSDNINYTTSLSAKSLPDFGRIMTLPAPYYTVKADAGALRGAFSRLAATVESNDFPFVDIKFVSGELRIQSKGKDKGHLVEPVDIGYDGPEILMRVTLAYLLDSLSGVDSVSIHIKEPSQERPFHIIVDHDECSFKTRHVIMPQAMTGR